MPRTTHIKISNAIVNKEGNVPVIDLMSKEKLGISNNNECINRDLSFLDTKFMAVEHFLLQTHKMAEQYKEYNGGFAR
jgi:hypothetical protein